MDWVYELLSKLRMPMGKGMDAVLAMRRMKMTSEGIEVGWLACRGPAGAGLWPPDRRGTC